MSSTFMFYNRNSSKKYLKHYIDLLVNSTANSAYFEHMESSTIPNSFLFFNNSKHTGHDSLLPANVSCFTNDTHQGDCFGNSSNSAQNNVTFDELDTILPPFELWQRILIGICCSFCVILTVCGNILVITSFIVERAIRQPSNYFIASLAVTDLVIGLISMPFFTVYVLMGQWSLGPVLCDLWLSVDYTVCLVSQYTVLLITIDRFCSVKIAAKYRTWRTRRKVIVMVAMTWIIPACLFFTSIFGWEHFVGYRDLKPHECEVQFLSDPIFNTALIVTYYWVTLVILIILYSGIYKTAFDMQKKSEAKHRRMQTLVALSAGGMPGLAGGMAGVAGIGGRSTGFGITKTQIAVMDQDDQTPDTPVLSPENNPLAPATQVNITVVSNNNDSSYHNPGSSKCDASRTIKSKDQPNERSSSPTFESDEDSSQFYESCHKTKSDSKESLSNKKSNNQSADILQKIPEQTVLDTSRKEKQFVDKPPPVPPRTFSGKLKARVSSQSSTESGNLSPVGDSPVQKDMEKETSKIVRVHETISTFGRVSKTIPPSSLPINNIIAIVPMASSTPTDGVSTSLDPSSNSRATNEQSSSLAVNASSVSAPTSLTSSCLSLGHPVAYDVLTGLDPSKLAITNQSSGPSVLDCKNLKPQSSLCNVKKQSTSEGDITTVNNVTKQELGKDKLNKSLGVVSKNNTIVSNSNVKYKRDSFNNSNVSSTSSTILNTARCLFTKKDRRHEMNSEDDEFDMSLDEGDDLLDPGNDRKLSSHSTDVVVTSILGTCTAAVANISNKNPSKPTCKDIDLHMQLKPESIENSTSESQYQSTSDALKTDTSIADNDPNSSSNKTSLNQLITTHNIHSNKTKTSVAKTDSISVVEKDASTFAGGASETQSSLRSSLKESRKGITKSLRSLKKKKKKNGQVRHRSKSENRANKALRTISIILGCFVACWTPYHILAIAESWCKCTNDHVYMFTYFLCYANSPLNPFCYALANQQFKKTFTRILHGDLHFT